DRLGKEADAIGLGSIELQIKRGEIQQAEDTIKALRAERERLKVEVGSKVERITSFQQAEPPKTRSLRLQVLSAAFAGVVALALGGLGVSFWEFRRRRIYSPSEVSDDLGLHVVGTMPPSYRGARPAAGPDAMKEAIDAIRAILLRSMGAVPYRVV